MFLLAGPLISAQTIVQGTVRDGRGEPVVDAIVELMRSNGFPVANRTTAADGRFLFKYNEPGE